MPFCLHTSSLTNYPSVTAPLPLSDIQAHLDDPRLTPEHQRALLRSAAATGVTDILTSGAEEDFAAWQTYLLQEQLPLRLFREVGVHPLAANVPEKLRELTKELASTTSPFRPVAIGEIGLDNRWSLVSRAKLTREAEHQWYAAQEELLWEQLRLARQARLPVILHVVGRKQRLLEILEEFGGLEAGMVLHGFTGPAAWVKRYLALNAAFSFGRSLLNPQAKRVQAAALAVPLEALLLESDLPVFNSQGELVGDWQILLAILEVLSSLKGVTVAELRVALSLRAVRQVLHSNLSSK